MPFYPVNLDECTTVQMAQSFFTTYGWKRANSGLTPASDAEFALLKLRPTNRFITPSLLLRPDQIGDLWMVIDQQPTTWESYCNALTLKQIQFIGW